MVVCICMKSVPVLGNDSIYLIFIKAETIYLITCLFNKEVDSFSYFRTTDFLNVLFLNPTSESYICIFALTFRDSF